MIEKHLSSLATKPPRVRRRLAAGLRHSRRVAVLRIALPVAALGLLLVLFLWPAASERRIVALPPTVTTPQLTMEKPRFTGADDQNRPFVLQAEKATQLPHDLMQVDLLAPQASMTMPDGLPVAGKAAIGRFDQAKKRLWLGGDVALEQKDGQDGQKLRFTTSELFADLAERTVWGDKPVRLSGAFGTIEGQGFRVFDGGKTLLFTGASRAILTGEGGMNAVPQIFESRQP